jgi:hypothetical protein
MGVLLLLSNKLLAVLAKSTNRPSALIIGAQESPPPPAGAGCAGSRPEANRKTSPPQAGDTQAMSGIKMVSLFKTMYPNVSFIVVSIHHSS